ncbi:PrgI family protein [Candidatus Gracilibacteria bacterium]|nr:PrgI family protein [Candidatus Gracilibacteria bacterium]
MQYKIPVQIENEDPIFLGLSLRQLFIIMVGGGFAYLVFNSLVPQTGPEVALLPSGFIFLVTVLVAVFKQYEMTFVPFVIAFIRLNIFPRERRWQSGVDSFQPIDIGFVTQDGQKEQQNVDMQKKIDTMDELQEKLRKL